MGLSHLFLSRSAVNLLANLVNSARNDCRVKRMDEGKKFSNKEKSFTYILAFITTYATVDMMIQPIHTSLNIQRLAFLLFAIDNNQMKFWQ